MRPVTESTCTFEMEMFGSLYIVYAPNVKQCRFTEITMFLPSEPETILFAVYEKMKTLKNISKIEIKRNLGLQVGTRFLL